MNSKPVTSIRADAVRNVDASELDKKKRPSLVSEVGRFSERLRAAIGESSVRAFAQGIGVSPAVFHQYLHDKSEPTRPIMNAIAKAGNVNLLWLSTGEGPMRPGDDDSIVQPVLAVSLDYELLQNVITAVNDAVAAGAYDLSASQEAALITGVYQCFSSGPPGVPISKSAVELLLRAINPAKKEKR